MLKRIGQIVLIALVAVVPYLGVIDGPFLYDDALYVTGNEHVTQDDVSLSEIFSASYPPGDPSLGLYRPLLTATYRWNRLLSGDDPRSYHLLNIMAHLAASLALFGLLRSMMPRRRFPLIAALIFAAHPVHTEAVTWIVGRGEIFSALFTFLAFWCHVAWWKRPGGAQRAIWLPVLCGVFFCLGLLSKEMAITLPVVMVVHDLMFRRSTFPALFRIPTYWILGTASVAYLFVRFSVLGRFGPDAGQQIAAFHEEAAVGSIMISAVAGYLRVILFPFNLQVDYPVRPDGGVDGLPSMLLACFILAGFIFCFFRARRSRSNLFFLVWFAVALFPVSNIIPIGTFMGERLAYLPSAPLLVASCLLLERALLVLRKRRGASFAGEFAVGMTAVCLVGLCLGSWYRNLVWQDEKSFWEAAATDSPYSFKAHVNLGNLLQEAGDAEGAERCFRQAIEVKPRLIEALSNLAGLLADRGEHEEAEGFYRRALEVNGRISLLQFNLANLLFQAGRDEEGRDVLRTTIQCEPYLPVAVLRLAASLGKEHPEEAIDLLRAEGEKHPEIAEFAFQRGEIYRFIGEFSGAETGYRDALAVDGTHLGARMNLGAVLAKVGQNEAAHQVFMDIARDHPDLEMARKNLQFLESKMEAASAAPPDGS